MMRVSKYFWDLNDKAAKEAEIVLRQPHHPKFIARLVSLLSRCDKPKELFSLISKDEFMEIWPKARAYWIKTARESDFRDWWQTIYEQLLREYKIKEPRSKGGSSVLFLRIGRMLREARLRKGLSQNQLALKTGMKQPDISNIEEGNKNITLGTLTSLCKVLEIKSLPLN